MTKYTRKDGILYVLLIELEGKSLVKIGVTQRTIEDRVLEISLSIFKKFRYFPMIRPKRFRKTSDIFDKEKQLHEMFKEHNHKPAKKFSGYTELFDISLDDVVVAYEKLLSQK